MVHNADSEIKTSFGLIQEQPENTKSKKKFENFKSRI